MSGFFFSFIILSKLLTAYQPSSVPPQLCVKITWTAMTKLYLNLAFLMNQFDLPNTYIVETFCMKCSRTNFWQLSFPWINSTTISIIFFCWQDFNWTLECVVMGLVDYCHQCDDLKPFVNIICKADGISNFSLFRITVNFTGILNVF